MIHCAPWRTGREGQVPPPSDAQHREQQTGESGGLGINQGTVSRISTLPTAPSPQPHQGPHLGHCSTHHVTWYLPPPPTAALPFQTLGLPSSSLTCQSQVSHSQVPSRTGTCPHRQPLTPPQQASTSPLFCLTNEIHNYQPLTAHSYPRPVQPCPFLPAWRSHNPLAQLSPHSLPVPTHLSVQETTKLCRMLSTPPPRPWIPSLPSPSPALPALFSPYLSLPLPAPPPVPPLTAPFLPVPLLPLSCLPFLLSLYLSLPLPCSFSPLPPPLHYPPHSLPTFPPAPILSAAAILLPDPTERNQKRAGAPPPLAHHPAITSTPFLLFCGLSASTFSGGLPDVHSEGREAPVALWKLSLCFSCNYVFCLLLLVLC